MTTDLIHILLEFDLLKSKSPNVFKTREDINNFVAANQSDGIIDYRRSITDFYNLTNVFLINTENHSIKETLEKILDYTNLIHKIIFLIKSEYNGWLDEDVDNLLKLSKVKQNSPKDADMMKELIILEHRRHEAEMFENVNRYRVQIYDNLLYIETYIKKIDPRNSSSSNHGFC
jgi:hypothetical protein